MKQRTPQLVRAWLLLVLFVAGQAAIYAHSHQSNGTTVKSQHSTSQQTVTEKCQLCDAMHHNFMAVNVAAATAPAAISQYAYKTVAYSFVSFSLILSTGRAPPVSNCLS